MAVFSAEDQGLTFKWVDAPAEYADQIVKSREKIIEKLCDFNDVLADKFLNEEDISIDEIKVALRKCVIARQVIPAFCGTAFKNKGVQLMLDAVIDYLPSPLDVPPVEGLKPHTDEILTRKADSSEPFAALAFKIMTDPFVGVLTFVRVYSGKLKAGVYVYNATKGTRERVSRLLQMHADKREEIFEVKAGDIAALIGPKDVSTGDSLCDEANPIILEKIDIPAPVISTSIEPKAKGDHEKMVESLRKM